MTRGRPRKYAKSKDRQTGWTSLAIHRETSDAAEELAALLGKERGMIGNLSKAETIHAAVKECIERRRELAKSK